MRGAGGKGGALSERPPEDGQGAIAVVSPPGQGNQLVHAVEHEGESEVVLSLWMARALERTPPLSTGGADLADGNSEGPFARPVAKSLIFARADPDEPVAIDPEIGGEPGSGEGAAVQTDLVPRGHGTSLFLRRWSARRGGGTLDAAGIVSCLGIGIGAVLGQVRLVSSVEGR